MKILAVHNFHRSGSASGDDQVFKAETLLLEKHGNKIIRYSVSNDTFDNQNIFKKILSTFAMFWNPKCYRDITKIIKKEKPNIMHIHTFFPLISPSVLYAAKKYGVKVVATLHDTRFICPCATSLRNNEICNKCIDGKYFRMCKYACFKNSKMQSFIVALIFKFHRFKKSFYKKIDKYICLNDEQIHLLLESKFEKNKIVKKYNFVQDNLDINNDINVNCNLPVRYVLFYGRIGVEKGIRELMKIWDDLNIPLVIMGTGPLESELREWCLNKNNIYCLGYVEHDHCLEIVKRCEFVVFPSIWYEGCSMVEIESESLGKSLIAYDLGFSSEAIDNGYNGFKVELGDIYKFRKTIIDLWNNRELIEKLSSNARVDYEKKYTSENNYNQLIDIYLSTLEK